uniref:Uncharacterized protein n=3 Tax=Equus TaxID=9789 RepID=A0A9L0SDY2_HORSE
MKTSVKLYLWLLWKKQLRIHSHITITITSIITSMGISMLGTVSFQRISNRKQQVLLSILLLQAFITTISTRANKEGVTQRTETCQEGKVYNFLFHKRSSDKKDV